MVHEQKDRDPRIVSEASIKEVAERLGNRDAWKVLRDFMVENGVWKTSDNRPQTSCSTGRLRMVKYAKSDSIAYRPNRITMNKIDDLLKAGQYKSRVDVVDSAVQRYLTWEEYSQFMKQQIMDFIKDPDISEQIADAAMSILQERIREKLS